jgi:hypothetical protein
MAITLLDAMEDALLSLIKDNADAGVADGEAADDAKKRLINQLRALDGQEKQAYDNIFTSPIPEALQPHLVVLWSGGDKAAHLDDVEKEAFYKEPSFCHSAILPSQARFHGFVTENFSAIGEILDQNYDEGVSSTLLMATERPNRKDQEKVPFKSPAGDDQMLMVRDDSGRQNCEEYLNLDYKDYFFVSNIEGWRSFTLPNDSETKEYTEFDVKKSKGYVFACLARVSFS